ncbi:MAG TPA: AmmeMemoRadiSam system protein B, partial [Candidatus Obscuribacterales bacterium]
MTGFLFFGKHKGPQSRKRLARFAGTWYDDDPKTLDAQLDTFLTNARNQTSDRPYEPAFGGNTDCCGPVLSIISPHAGYMFSGQTAAFAYAKAREHRIDRVFLLGPSHYVGFEGVALPEEDIFATPLGDLPIDRAAVEELRDFPLFKFFPDVHRKEHSLELQLPLIRKTFGEVKLVPMVVGALEDEAEMRLVGQALRRFIGDRDLVVVSSDFCHVGPRYQYQPFSKDIRNNVFKLDNEAFQHMRRKDLGSFISFKERTGATICGFYPCCVLLSMLPNEVEGTVLKYATSQDSIAEDDENSVSYMAVAFSTPRSSDLWQTGGEEEAESKAELNESDRNFLLSVARRTVETYVKERRFIELPESLIKERPIFGEPRGTFVTLFKRKEPVASPVVRAAEEEHLMRELRGCIGHIWPVRTLLGAVVENAIGACSRDYRFHPVGIDELAHLQIEISVLTPLRRVDSYNEIVLGRHGIVMYRNGYQAVF